MNFEKALQELETIVAKLENGEVTLEEALSLYAEGVKLLSYCETALNQAEQKVTVLIKNEEVPFKQADKDEAF